jgi:hypothetical protein
VRLKRWRQGVTPREVDSIPSACDLPRRGFAPDWTPASSILVWQLIGWLIVDAAVLVFLPAPPRYEVILPLMGAQFATVVGWFVLGDGALLMRLPFLLAAVALAEPVQVLCGERVEPGMPTAATVGYLLGIAAPLLLLGFFGWSCQLPHAWEKAVEPKQSTRLQFTIWQLLCWTLVIAILLSVLRVLPARYVQVAAFTTTWGLAMSIVPALQWILLLRDNVYQAIRVGLGILAVTWIVGAWIAGGDIPATLAWVGITLLHTAVLGVNLLLLRRKGYRLRRSLTRSS